MFGDDTWIKLFPGMFDEYDGTASFFVSDFTEVDNNVTRHIDHQLAHQSDWDVLILHYLGLDHIGHKGGPQSTFMPAKQKEMDGIVERIYSSTAAEDEDTLIVVLGDHGMNEAGNHGGSSPGETSAATLLISSKFKSLNLNNKAPLPVSEDFKYYKKIAQGDLVPTFAALFDFPIPLNSLGVFLKDLLPLWSQPSSQTTVLQQNAHQLANILDSSYPGFKKIDAERDMFCESQIDFDDVSDLEHLKCLWWHIQDGFDSPEAVYEFLKKGQETLSTASSNYKEKEMFIGLGLASVALLLSGIYTWTLLRSVKTVRFILLLITVLYVGAMFGSSLVEEEHHLWYWGATGWIAWLYILTARKRFGDGFDWVFSMIMIRVIRSWNQTGQKYAGSPDIASFLGQSENAGILWFLIIAYYGSLMERMWKGSFRKLNPMFGFVLSFTTVAASIAFKSHMAWEAGETVPVLMQKLVGIDRVDGDASRLVGFARLSFFTIGSGMLYELSSLILGEDSHAAQIQRKPITNMTVFLEAFLVMQTKTTNIPLFIFFTFLKVYLTKAINKSFVYRSTKDLDDDNQEKFSVRVISITTISILIFQHMAFFAMGNSNSLASIDLSNAYNGVSSYNIPIVGALTFLSNWAGPLFWSFMGLSILVEDDFRVYFIKIHTTLKNLNNNVSKETDKQKLLKEILEKDVSLIGQNLITLKILITQVFFAGALTGIMGACIVLKDHLFIWTVFSPKLLYAAAWVVLQHCVIDVVLCTALSFLRG